MSFRRKDFVKTMDAVRKRTRAYLEDEVGLALLGEDMTIGSIDSLELRRVSVIVGTGGPVNLLIAFCFAPEIHDWLYDAATSHLEIAPQDRQLFMRETAAETVNIILGHATTDLAETGKDVTLSPPVVLEEGRSIHRPKKAMFATLKMQTNLGELDVHFIGPAELFDQKLNVLSEGE